MLMRYLQTSIAGAVEQGNVTATTKGFLFELPDGSDSSEKDKGKSAGSTLFNFYLNWLL